MKLLLGTLFCFLFANCFAQHEKTFIISLDKSNKSEKAILPFSAIQIIDARFDKSSIGCAIKDLSFDGITKNKMVAVFPDSLQTYLPLVVAKLCSLASPNPDTLVLLVKHFRFADRVFSTLTKKNKPESILMIAVSFYKKEGGRLFRIAGVESKWSKEWSLLDDESTPALSAARNEACTELFLNLFQNTNWRAGELSFSWAEMEDGLRRRYQLPILTDTTLRAGVYRSYSEFKNNNPSLTRCSFRTSKDLLQEVKDENNKLIEGTVWGACDGKYLYIFDGKYRKLLRSSNGFRYYVEQYQQRNGPSIINLLDPGIQTSAGTLYLPSISAKHRSNVAFVDLNLDTGSRYLEEEVGTGEIKMK
jgi:hypothetical protein